MARERWSYDPRWKSRAVERSRASRGFSHIDTWSYPKTLVVCPPPELLLLSRKLAAYEVLWCPENLGIQYGAEAGIYVKVIAEKIKESGIKYVEVHVQTYGHKSIKRLVRFMEDYAKLCFENPEAKINVIIPKLVQEQIEYVIYKEE